MLAIPAAFEGEGPHALTAVRLGERVEGFEGVIGERGFEDQRVVGFDAVH